MTAGVSHLSGTDAVVPDAPGVGRQATRSMEPCVGLPETVRSRASWDRSVSRVRWCVYGSGSGRPFSVGDGRVMRPRVGSGCGGTGPGSGTGKGPGAGFGSGPGGTGDVGSGEPGPGCGGKGSGSRVGGMVMECPLGFWPDTGWRLQTRSPGDGRQWTRATRALLAGRPWCHRGCSACGCAPAA